MATAVPPGGEEQNAQQTSREKDPEVSRAGFHTVFAELYALTFGRRNVRRNLLD